MPDAPISSARARGVGTARESEQINFVTGLIIIHDETIAIQDDLFEPAADGAAEKPFEEVAFRTYAIVVVHFLDNPAGALRLYEPPLGPSARAVEFRDVGIVGRSFLIPGAVD